MYKFIGVLIGKTCDQALFFQMEGKENKRKEKIVEKES